MPTVNDPDYISGLATPHVCGRCKAGPHTIDDCEMIEMVALICDCDCPSPLSDEDAFYDELYASVGESHGCDCEFGHLYNEPGGEA